MANINVHCTISSALVNCCKMQRTALLDSLHEELLIITANQVKAPPG